MSDASSATDVSRASALAHRIKHIPDPGMRAVKVAHYLRDQPPVEVVQTLARLVGRVSGMQDTGYTMALDSLTSALGDADLVSYDTRASLYMAAKACGHLEIARLFFDASPGLPPEAAALTRGQEDALAPERPLRPRGRPLTLGERKSLARSHRRDLLITLLRDPHPAVIRILLGNPRLTEPDVLRIASRRPSAPETLTMLARDPRWSVRYAVKCALVFNPYTPVPLAIRLLMTIRPADLRSIANDGKLSLSVREQATGLLRAGSRQ